MKLALVVAMAVMMQAGTLTHKFTTAKDGDLVITFAPEGSTLAYICNAYSPCHECYTNPIAAVFGPCLPIPKELQ